MDARLLIVTHGGDGAEIVDGAGSAGSAARPGGVSGGYLRRGRQLLGGSGDGAEGVRRSAEAAEFGNLVASITIMKKGTGTASPEEILAKC